ncbi:MAG: DNA repair protein RecN [Gammaproteobacteria bacterium]|nr:DNA repair protein RecN [Gammaproteobacteria bacterium]
MLSHLSIRNFAVVDQLEIDFKSGMTVITGETGAGKSIAIDALGFALGERADNSFIRDEKQRTEITANFDIRHAMEVKQWLTDEELDSGDDCIVRRTLSKDIGSRAYINGVQLPVVKLKQLADFLVEIHSQHAHHALLSANEQQRLLDAFANAQQDVATVANIYRQYSETKKSLQQLTAQQHERVSRIEFLRYQLDEFEKIDLQTGEWEQLDQEQRKFAHHHAIMQALNSSYQALAEDENNITLQLESVQLQLKNTIELDPSLKQSYELLESALISVNEATHDLRIRLDDNELDPERMHEIEQRLSEVHNLARKHRVPPEDLLQLHTHMLEELASLLDSDSDIQKYQQQLDIMQKDFSLAATQLSDKRQKAAKTLSNNVEKLIKQLGMPACRFFVEFQTYPENEFHAHGLEQIRFLINTNPGQEAKPLSKIASGGELSRISLAIQVSTANVVQRPTLIFDEVDVGIGGGVAEIVGDKLYQLGLKRQVICITHQAQVACKGHQHLFVEKKVSKKQTNSQIRTLENEERVIEIARMIGGIELTETTIEHAREMLNKENSRSTV